MAKGSKSSSVAKTNFGSAAKQLASGRDGRSGSTCDDPDNSKLFKYQVGQGPGNLYEISETGAKMTWLTDPRHIYIFTEVLPLIAGILIFTFFLMVSLVLIYSLVRHYYLDHVLPKIFFTLKPLRKDKLKIIYVQYPDEVALNNLGFFKWNPVRRCFRRHSICQLQHHHRNHRKLTDPVNSNDRLKAIRLIKADSQIKNSQKNMHIQLKSVAAISRLVIKQKKQLKLPKELSDPEITNMLPTINIINESSRPHPRRQSKNAQKKINFTAPNNEAKPKRKRNSLKDGEQPKVLENEFGEQPKLTKNNQQMKQTEELHYKQPFPTAEIMLSVDDIKVNTQIRKGKRRPSKKHKLSLKNNLLSQKKEENAQKEIPETNTKPVPGSKKRKSSTPNPVKAQNIKKSSLANPKEGVAKKVIPVKKKTLMTSKQGKVQMKVFKKPDLNNKPKKG